MPRGLLVVVAKGPHELNQYPLLAIRELKQRGYAVVPLAAGVLQYQPTGITEIDDIANQLNLDLNYARCEAEAIEAPEPNWLSRIPFIGKLFVRNKWGWDPANYELSYAGINAYWGIREDLCCRERRYSIDFDSPRYTVWLADIRKRIESWELCLRKISAVGKARGIPVRLILQYIHLSTHYYCRRYVEAVSAEQDISVIHSAIAYENYFLNFVKDESTTIALQDMTRMKDLAASSYAPSDWFLRYYKTLSDTERDIILSAVEKVTKQDRVRRERTDDTLERLEFFKAERERGRRVVGLFGKVLFDQGLPRGDGVVHQDMRDWFDHSVEIARRNPNMHLIIKPHPHELRDEIALYASEVLKDWLPNPVPKNVHFLGNDEFNLHELAQVLDVALVWNGMSALELGVLGVPTTLGAYYGVINFPVGHPVPTSRQDFEHLVVNHPKIEMSDEVRCMSAALIDYFRHPDVSVPYRYTYRGLTNKHIHLHWFDEDLKSYEAKGDPYVKVLADRLEGVAYAPRSQ
jgi:capsular polysaccharide export protein